MMTVRC